MRRHVRVAGRAYTQGEHARRNAFLKHVPGAIKGSARDNNESSLPRPVGNIWLIGAHSGS